MNLSNYPLGTTELRGLEKGLTFVPYCHRLPIKGLLKTKNDTIRNLKLLNYFKDKKDNVKNKNKLFTYKSDWTPDDGKLSEDIVARCEKINEITTKTIFNYIKSIKVKNEELKNDLQKIITEGKFDQIDTLIDSTIRLDGRSNISRDEVKGLRELSNNTNLIIKPADKGGAIVIMNRGAYVQEAKRQLNDNTYYRRIPEPLCYKSKQEIEDILIDMYNNNYINKKQLEFLKGPTLIRERIFYLLPKIHKPQNSWPQPGKMPEGRPIISDINSETYNISIFINHYIHPLSTKHNTYIKNSFEFVNKLKNLDISDLDNYLFVTGDVTALYTNMETDRSIECIKKALADNPEENRPDREIVKLLEICLRKNDFLFNNNYYLQTKGTAMGKRFSPALANIYLIEFDKVACSDFHIKPVLFVRYIDDIFFLWPSLELDTLKEYEIFLNRIIPGIKITLKHHTNKIDFLDVCIYKKNNQINTKIFFKETDTHQLLHKDSFHPKHTCTGILKAQMIRFKRICSNHSDYEEASKVLFKSLKNRGYSYSLLRKIKTEVWYNYKGKQERVNEKEQERILPIVVSYSDLGTNLATALKNHIRENFDIENNKLLTANKCQKNLGQMLIRSEMPSAEPRAFRKCGMINCNLCKYHVQYQTTFQSTTTKKIFHLKHDLSCNSRNIIYLITCKKCLLQYVGETGRSLNERFHGHKYAINHKTDTSVGKHFNLPRHTYRDISIIAVERINDNTQNAAKIRRIRERWWQKTLRTISPEGLNSE